MERFSTRLKQAVARTGGFLCVGLDVDMAKLPEGIPKDARGAYQFCRAIVDATKDLAAAYKPNLAFFEALGPAGWEMLEALRKSMPPGALFVADAKRGDIGNTSRAYAEAFFGRLKCDALTVAPYMGKDSVEPFLGYPGSCVFVLCLTSNPSAAEFETQKLEDGSFLYEKVAKTALEWGKHTQGEVGLVVGATQAETLGAIRSLAPQAPFLVPGVGAQGGDLESVLRDGRSSDGAGLLVNASRSILYASKGPDFALAAKAEATRMIQAMKPYMPKN